MTEYFYRVIHYMGLSISVVFFLVSNVHSLMIRTDPPISIRGFTCSCSLANCVCSAGPVSVVVDLSHLQGEDMVCEEECLEEYGKVIAVSIPYLSQEKVRSFVKQMTKRSGIQDGREGVLRDDAVSRSYTRNLRQDLTMYLISELAVRKFSVSREELRLSHYLDVLRDLLYHIRRGSVDSYIASFNRTFNRRVK